MNKRPFLIALLLLTLPLAFAVGQPAVLFSYTNSSTLFKAIAVLSDGQYVYAGGAIGSPPSTLMIFDVSNNASFQHVASYINDSNAGVFDILTQGDVLYLSAIYSDRIIALNKSNPLNMTFLGDVHTTQDYPGADSYLDACYSICKQNPLQNTSQTYIYCTAANSGYVTAMNFTDSTNPAIVGHYQFPMSGNGPVDCEVQDDVIYFVAPNYAGFRTLNISDPAHMQSIFNMSVGNISYSRMIAVNGTYVYVTGEFSDSVTIFNMTSPTTADILSEVRSSDFGNIVDAPHKVGLFDTIMVIGAESSNTFVAFNISDKTHPTLINYDYDPSHVGSVQAVSFLYPRIFIADEGSNSVSALNLTNLISYESVPIVQIGPTQISDIDAVAAQTSVTVTYTNPTNSTNSSGEIISSGLTYPEYGGYQLDTGFKQAATPYSFSGATVTSITVPIKYYASSPSATVEAHIRSGITSNYTDERVCNSTNSFTSFTSTYTNYTFTFSGCTPLAGTHYITFTTTQTVAGNGLLIPIQIGTSTVVKYNNGGSSWSEEAGSSQAGIVYLSVNGSSSQTYGTTLYNGTGDVLFNATNSSVNYTQAGLTPNTAFTFWAQSWYQNGSNYDYNPAMSSGNNITVTTLSSADVVSVSLVSPANGSNVTNSAQSFSFFFTSSANSVLPCSVFVNDSTLATNVSTANYTTTALSNSSFVGALPVGVYEWYASCSGNVSASRVFTIPACTPNWSCSSFAACNVSNVSACLAVSDANLCGDAFAGNLSTYDMACVFVPPVEVTSVNVAVTLLVFDLIIVILVSFVIDPLFRRKSPELQKAFYWLYAVIGVTGIVALLSLLLTL